MPSVYPPKYTPCSQPHIFSIRPVLTQKSSHLHILNQFIYNENHPLKVYSPTSFSKYIHLCNHDNGPDIQTFPLFQNVPSCPFLSLWIILLFLDFSHKWNCTDLLVCNFFQGVLRSIPILSNNSSCSYCHVLLYGLWLSIHLSGDIWAVSSWGYYEGNCHEHLCVCLSFIHFSFMASVFYIRSRIYAKMVKIFSCFFRCMVIADFIVRSLVKFELIVVYIVW